MDLLLFNCYMKTFHKKSKFSFWNNIIKFPFKCKLFFILVFISLIFGIYFLFKSNLPCSILCFIFEYIFSELFHYYFDNYKIEISDSDFNDYLNKYKSIKIWLNNKGFSNNEKVKEIICRIHNQIETYSNGRLAAYNRLEKWFQTLAIPTTLIVVEYVFTSEFVFLTKIIECIFPVLLLISINSFLKFLIDIQFIRYQTKIEYLKEFISDLQGVIDLDELIFN